MNYLSRSSYGPPGTRRIVALERGASLTQAK
jgi:hypothetical protein